MAENQARAPRMRSTLNLITVWCNVCGGSTQVGMAMCFKDHQPICCGQTMTIDPPRDFRWFAVELEDGCWLADWEGDPGRTLQQENAKRFRFHADALKALRAARVFRPFANAKITRVPEPAQEASLDGQNSESNHTDE